jgi:hypothetical protein
VYRQVEPDGLQQLKDPGTWPDDIRWIREQFVKDWRKWTAKDQSTIGWTPPYVDSALCASPRFFVAKAGQLLETAPSKDGWTHYIAPLLTKLLGA